jgi:hypothetical protein
MNAEWMLLIVFIIYLIIGMRTPDMVAEAVNSLAGKISIFLVVVYMFLNMNPLVATAGLLVAFELLRRSHQQEFGDDQAYKFSPASYNRSPYTLEQEIVAKMAPRVNAGAPIGRASYLPTLDNLYDATPLM